MAQHALFYQNGREIASVFLVSSLKCLMKMLVFVETKASKNKAFTSSLSIYLHAFFGRQESGILYKMNGNWIKCKSIFHFPLLTMPPVSIHFSE
ncbi:hypothetical protein [Heyndrickxia coagulans]|nr:hypothetical protein [Heyndrickxia coagulans]